MLDVRSFCGRKEIENKTGFESQNFVKSIKEHRSLLLSEFI